MDEKPTYQELEKRIQELEQALQKGEEKYRILLDESSDPFFSFYPDGKYRYVNQAFAEGVGKAVDEIVGHSIWDIYPGEEGDKRFSVVKHVFATGKPKTIEVQVPRPEGDQYYITTAKAVKDSNGKVISVVCSSKNITDRKQTEEMLRESEERFKYLTEASFESIFFSENGVCIEQNPAAEIMFGYTSEEAIGRPGTDWIAPESKDLVMRNMMNKITEPYEAIAQRKDGSTFPARIHAKEMQYKGRTIRVASLRNITDFKMLENDLRSREERFRLIAHNKPEKWVGGISDITDQKQTELEKDDLERIFEPFYTKKVMGRSGTGLGLAVVWNVMQDHQCYIDVKSDKNGTTFELYFPITRDEIADKDLSIPIKDYKGNGETILVVDDVESQREISSKMLDTLGYKTIAVSSGEEAVEYFKENTVDLLLLDMIMDPGINGLETYERIIKIHPNQKAIIISGFAESDEVKEAQKLGAGRYIKKPVTLEKIGLSVKEELEK